jgi:hypothetical protein
MNESKITRDDSSFLKTLTKHIAASESPLQRREPPIPIP